MDFKTIVKIFIFTGSVFITSSRFVNEINSPKYYFVILSGLFFLAFFFISSKNKQLFNSEFNINLYFGLYGVCLAQACYGLSQYFDFTTSFNSNFKITGSFDNPAGFTSLLAIGFPVGLFLISKTAKIKKYLLIIGSIVICIAVFLSGSRAGVLAILISTILFFLFQKKTFHEFKKLKYNKLCSFFAFSFLIVIAYYLYTQKKDSADGRIFIWKVSSEMIKEKFLLGHGYGAFQTKYMDYQATYFQENPNSKFTFFADDVKEPFNEFIKIGVEFGIIGLSVLLFLIFMLLFKIYISKRDDKDVFFCGFISFLVVACFSYPIYYVPVWVLLFIYFFQFFLIKKIEIKKKSISIITRATVVIVCVFFIRYNFNLMQSEIKWKTIAIKSLNGNTEEMLPKYEKLYLTTPLNQNPYFLYNYCAELNFVGKYNKSIEILYKCKLYFNDYELQMLLANNYFNLGKIDKAIQTYQQASNMIPCRILPLYYIFGIHNQNGNKILAIKYAKTIVDKKIKIQSITTRSIKEEAQSYLVEN